ncbi:NapC/NirT family cytochrome c [Neobacillus sp. Marseille-QA0830]
MDEEHRSNQPSPPKFRYKFYKIATFTVMFLVVFFAIGEIGLKATTSSGFCASCHEMKPEVYTWKASTHSEVDCTNCHTDPGLKEIAKDQATGVIKKLRNEEELSAAIIRMANEIPDSACEKCHNMSNRNVTASGDIIISHTEHKDKNIKCTQCHSGVAHGKVADRNMTFKTDYAKWDASLGKTVMSEVEYTRPTMDTCMECHENRQITTECSACHTTGMLPKSHKDADFKTKTHGLQAKDELKDCNSCHKYMSTSELEGYEEASVLSKYLSTENKGTDKNASTYAKENTFCLECHKTRPASHTDNFFSSHGSEASKNQEKCFTCHENNKTGTAGNNAVNCSTCHQKKHLNKWRENHPISVGNVTKPQESCYTCHVKKTCSNCHK